MPSQPDARLALRNVTAAAAMAVNRHDAGQPIPERIWTALRKATIAAVAVIADRRSFFPAIINLTNSASQGGTIMQLSGDRATDRELQSPLRPVQKSRLLRCRSRPTNPVGWRVRKSGANLPIRGACRIKCCRWQRAAELSHHGREHRIS
jgi:hypothetical protein